MADKKLPELLAPAGSYSAFVAAISSGADAVYLGGADFNARINAVNFTNEEIARAVSEAHFLGKKVYITLNTLISDREISVMLDYVQTLLKVGADAFIVQDLGVMRALKECFPEAVFHASTQCITHSLDGVNMLRRMGAQRAVIARELDKENIYRICRESEIEIEAFVHGALCVCHSGACLFSSLVGGRSGNRGECAQPCRLPYMLDGTDNAYPLSLRDLSLSGHICDLVEAGVASLKIEGRMKTPEYVGGVVGVFRELLDMGRNADESDMKRLARIFSRGGFTDGYYTGKLGKGMLGVRSREDKEQTRAVEKIEYKLPKITIDADFSITSSGAELKFTSGNLTSVAVSDAFDTALNRPLDSDGAREQIAKLGGTAFELGKFSFTTDKTVGGYIVPKSALNDLRRRALENLQPLNAVVRKPLTQVENVVSKECRRYVVLAPHRVEKTVPDGIDRMYFPLFKMPNITSRVGVTLPLVIKDSEKAEVASELLCLYKNGVKYAYCESLSAVALAASIGFEILAGVRINAYNSYTLAALQALGVSEVVMSSELNEAMRRDLKKPIPTGAIVYGKIPLMTMENCVMNFRDGCRECGDFKTCRKSAVLSDRKGVLFPVYPEFYHRCQIYNSVVSYNADRMSRLAAFGVIYITDEASVSDTVKKIVKGEKPKEYTRK